MPKKTVREMTALERQHYSLSARVFHSTVMGAIIMGSVALIVGLGLYLYALVGQYTSEAFNLTRTAGGLLHNVVYFDPLVENVMDDWHALSPEEKSKTGTPEYRIRFAHYSERADYQTLIAVLDNLRGSSDVNDLYLGMYDSETSALVYIADPDTTPEYINNPGDWEEVIPRETEKFLNWDGNGKLYDISNTEHYGWMCTAGTPLYNQAGDLICFVLADVTLDEVADGMKSFLIQYALSMLMVTNLFAILLTHHFKKTLVKPINAIAQAAQDYVRDRNAGMQTPDHFSRLNIRTGDEVENLSLVMADMEQDLSDYMDNLTTITAEKERISTELDLARRIQANMLPSTFPPFPERTDIDIYACMNPAKEVGGDFYDFFLLDQTHLGLVIADVSGKGVPAALVMMISKILIQNFILGNQSPSEVLQMVNMQMCRNNQAEMFITVWIGILDLETGTLTASNAGHEYPIIRQPGGSFEVLKDRHGFVVGGMESTHYQDYHLTLEPGSRLFLYTDGVPEATDADNQLFGIDRTLDALNRAKGGSPRRIVENVEAAIRQFVGEAPQFDDLTILCLAYDGPAAETEMVPAEQQLTDTDVPLAEPQAE